MADVTKTIGTLSRDYSTITLWEADLDDTGIYSSGDVAIGQCYNDSAFNEEVTINGGGTVGLTSRTLEAASGEIHDGTEGSGARNVFSTGGTPFDVNIATLIRGLEVSNNDADSSGLNAEGIRANSVALDVRRCIVHGSLSSGSHSRGITCEDVGGTVVRCFVYQIKCTSTNVNRHCESIVSTQTPTAATEWYNNTVLRNTRDNANGRSHCYSFADDADVTIRNCLGFLSGGTTTLVNDFRRTSPSNATVNHVGASDTSASGTNSIDSMTTADELVSSVEGSENLHLKSGGQAIDAGVDLVTTPAGVNIDIDGRDVDAEGDTWDMGADEFVAAAAAVFTRSVVAQQSVHRSNYY